MNEQMKCDVLQRLASLSGEAALYYRCLTTNETLCLNENHTFNAASVIKLPILIEAFRQAESGLLDLESEYALRDADRVPPCGALTFLHTGVRLTWRDLCVMMIILSDNTATNILIDRLGIENVASTLRALGLERTALRRKLYDAQAASRALRNTVSAAEIGRLLEGLYRGAIVSPAASAEMLEILKNQQLNGKIPFFLGDMTVAHKTGEDEGLTHDAGLVFAPRGPFILCLFTEHTDVPMAERAIQDIARMLSMAECP